MRLLRKEVPKHIQLIPKIESVKGIKNVIDICRAGKTDIIMLDKEDLYTDLNRDSIKFNHWVEIARGICKENNIEVLELQGVIFAEK
jgi:hypothetical protein